MNYENLKIEIKGLKLAKPAEKLVREIAEKIHWESPSDACIKLVCEPVKQAARASCKIASQAGIFDEEVVSDCPEKSLKKLETKIKHQLDMWKRNRFSNLFEETLESAS